jgi:hypothetical protein
MKRRRLLSRLIGPIVAVCVTSACVTTDTPRIRAVELGAQLDSRAAIEARVSEPVRLLDQNVARAVVLPAADEVVRILALDNRGTIHHVLLDRDGRVSREAIGVVEPAGPQTFDAVEWPPGVVRVIAGASQFIRSRDDPTWKENKGNLCHRFVTASNRLYCAFLMSGETLGSPKRTDWHGGLLFIIPFAIPSSHQSTKLVLAEETSEGWVTRVVLDAEDDLDTQPEFVISADNGGNIHFVYTVKGGGSLWLLPLGGGDIASPRLRYAQLDAKALRSSVAGNRDDAARQFFSAHGRDVPRLRTAYGLSYPKLLLQSWPSGLSWNPFSGELEALWYVNILVGDPGSTIVGQRDGVLHAVMRNGEWLATTRLVLAENWPRHGASYSEPTILFDSAGTSHALVRVRLSTTSRNKSDGLSYLMQRGGEWTRPVFIETDSNEWSPGAPWGVATKTGLFALSTSRESGLVGRWIRPQ